MPNRLANEKSPYLLQHAENPVDWYPWGDEAFRKAALENRPVFLSIGYATCHWCHVMERESFEDAEVADFLNRNYVAIKVDREERPDIDQIYMSVCQALTGHGGWPLSIVMTPEKKPFFAGSYFPKRGRMGMPGFLDILEQLHGMWTGHPERIQQAGEEITRVLQPKGSHGGGSLDLGTLEAAHSQLARSFDPTWGGFGNAPKFPTPHHLTFLLRWHRRHPESDALFMVEKTLDAMRNGGVYDHLGYGFHRYSVDARWHAPHFEKMLYDQAMIAMAYLEAYSATRKPLYAATAHEIFTYVLRDMTDPEGGFYSAEDADTRGVEGLFYTWTPDEVDSVLGEERGALFRRFYDISPGGNFEEGRSIPHLSRSFETAAETLGMDPRDFREKVIDARERLFSARRNRPRPLRDDKVLTSWNGLMIAALAQGYQVLQDPCYVQAATRAVKFILEHLVVDGRLHRRHRAGETAVPAYADDYAFFIWGLLNCYEATFDLRHLETALELQRQMTDLFWDTEHGGFFFTGRDAEKLIVREKEIYDGAVPASNSVAALNLLRLARMTANPDLEAMAVKLLDNFSQLVADFPSAYTQFLNAVDFAVGPSRQFFIAGNPKAPATQAMLRAVQEAFIPNRVVVLLKEGPERDRMDRMAPFLSELHAMNGGPTAYVCENFACRKPVVDLEGLRPYLGP